MSIAHISLIVSLVVVFVSFYLVYLSAECVLKMRHLFCKRFALPQQKHHRERNSAVHGKSNEANTTQHTRTAGPSREPHPVQVRHVVVLQKTVALHCKENTHSRIQIKLN